MKNIPQKGFVAPILLIIIALLVIGGGVYIYEKMEAPVPVNNAGQSPQNNPLASASNPASSTTTSTSSVVVAGMSKYTDADFGFSFWYPSSWTIEQVPVRYPNSYAGGTVKKILRTNNDGKYPGVEIEEYYSDRRTITFPGGRAPAGNCCPAQRIYFDTTAHTWMVEYPEGDDAHLSPDGVYGHLSPGTTVVANVSKNTMGGLHLFDDRLARFDAVEMIPLSAKNFLVVRAIEGRIGGGWSVHDNLLVQTIVATDPSVATPISASEQLKIIHKEALIYGAIGTSIGNGRWYKDNTYVYDSEGNIVSGANPATYKQFTFWNGSDNLPSDYVTDGVHIYYSGHPPLVGVDPATFVLIGQGVAKDATHVWFDGRLIPGADPKTFIFTGQKIAKDANHTYDWTEYYKNWTLPYKNIFKIDGVSVDIQ